MARILRISKSVSASIHIRFMPRMIRDERISDRLASLIGSGGYIHIAFSLGRKEAVDELTETLRSDGYDVISGPRTTGDGYYESCIVVVEGNQIEITE